MNDDEMIFPSHEEFVKFTQNCILVNNPLHLQNVDVVNSKLILYLKTIANHIQIFLHKDVDFYQFGLYLINSELFEHNRLFCISKILSILKMCSLDELEIELNLKFFVNYILLLDSKNNSDSLQLIMDFDGFKIMYYSLRNNFRTIRNLNVNDEDMESGTMVILKKLNSIQLDFLFLFCKYLTVPLDNLMTVDRSIIEYIFNTLIVAYNEEDFYNASKFKFVLALNEQYMIHKHNDPQKTLSNLVFETILASKSSARNFIECLLIYFNRENDKVLLIMIAKILYLIFTNDDTTEMFYRNDLNVLIDVVIRELTNLEDDEVSIKNTFLRVLYPILKNEQIFTNQYKRDPLQKLLKFLSGESVESNFFQQDETTKRLAKKCLALEWLRDDETPDPNALKLTESNDSLASINSLNSISKRRPAPPIPQPRKFLLRKSCPPIPSPRISR